MLVFRASVPQIPAPRPAFPVDHLYVVASDELERASCAALLSAHLECSVVHVETMELVVVGEAEAKARTLALWLLDPETVVDLGLILAVRRRCPVLAVLTLTRTTCQAALQDLIARQPKGVGLQYRPDTVLIDLLTAIEIVARGRFWLDPRLARQALALEQQAANPYALTGTELLVANGIAGALRNSAIAKQLHMSEKSVEKHVTAIYTKLDLERGDRPVHRRVQAALVLGGAADETTA